VYVRVGAVDAAGRKVTRVQQLSFLVDEDSSDKALAHQVTQFLPLCESAIRVRAFIRTHSRYEYGSISHAIAASLKEMLREFDLIIAQLEHLLSLGRLTLQKLVYLLQSSRTTLRALDHLTLRLKDLVGGQMMDALHMATLEQGDERVKRLYEHVLQAATRPFILMLSQWLYEGELQDVYKEFFIQEHTAVLREALQEDFNAHYWEGRYTLATQHVPRILHAHAGKALTAGKYLNVIRDCMTGEGFISRDPHTHAIIFKSSEEAGEHSQQASSSSSSSSMLKKRELRYDLDGSSSLVHAVEEAYQFSSNTLLKILEEKYHLYSHLKSLRRFFLLEHGDFFVQFMDTAASELGKEAKDVPLSRIRSLLQLAVHTSTLASDPNREELSCSLASHNLIQHLHLIQTAGGDGPSLGGSGSEAYALKGGSQGLKGVEALTLDYNVGWPLSIVLSRRAITKYQLLSRLLFFCKHVELKVLGCWKDHQNTKEMGLRNEMGSTYALRHRMLHFLQNFVYYMTIEVFTPRSHELQNAMKEVR
jgi:gamma-tubulin complex component 2